MSQCYSFKISIKKFWFVLIPLLLIGGAFGVSVGYLLIDKVLMPTVTNISNKGEVETPSITGLTYDEATQKLYDLGLHISIREREYDESLPEKSIISQEPLVGKKVKQGRHIFVIVSKGSEVDTIPSLLDLKEGPAKSSLRKAGFKNIKVKNKFSSKVEKNEVVGTVPKSGVVTSREVEVILTLSKGVKPTHTVVPSLVGDMLSAAKFKIDSVGLVVGIINYKKSDIMGPGHIISQSISPGSTVELDSKVELLVSIAP
jgi:beta-lactam-binding protein with PASTA domain